jgi:hypothetical protein
MYPTVGMVKTRFRALLDDPSGAVFTDDVFNAAFGEAFDSLFAAMLTAQCPRIELMQQITVPAMNTGMTPADMGIADFGDYVFLRERPLGSSDKFREMTSVDVLPQRQPSDMLRWFNWRNNTFYWIGATQNIQLEIKWEASGTAPVSPAADATQVMVDSSLSFLSNYAVGVAGQRKGYDAIAQRCFLQAVGPKYLLGSMGGQLYMLIQPLVRSRQNVQIAHRPFQAGRRLWAGRAIPYVAAQQGTTGGGAQNVPIQLSTGTNDGSVVGVIDGTNTVFTLNIFGIVSQILVFRNGVGLTFLVDYTYISNVVTFMSGSAPQPGDILTFEVYLAPSS